MEIAVLFFVFALLFAVGVPIAFCIGMATVCSFLLEVDIVPAITTTAQRMAGGVNSFALLAIPLFRLMSVKVLRIFTGEERNTLVALLGKRGLGAVAERIL